jgi:ComF family protein
MIMTKSWLASLAAVVWPRFCYRCGRGGEYLCDRCWQELEFAWPREIKAALIKKLPPGRPFYLNSVQVAFAYDPLVAKMLRDFKYAGVKELAETFGYALYQFLPLPADVAAVTYIPLQRRRARQRGYNQAQLLAQVVAAKMNLPCVSLLKRPQAERPQVMKNLSARQSANLKFTLKTEVKPNLKSGQALLLVDDVVTTGATLNSAARTLSEAGYRSYGVCVAHGN